MNKEDVEFYKANDNKKDGLRPYCKPCDIQRRIRYKKTPVGIINQQKSMVKIREKFGLWWQEFKSTLKCEAEGCNVHHPACLDFHHIDPSKKKINLAEAHRNIYNKELIMEEVKKCKVLCANHHRILHYDERKKKKEETTLLGSHITSI